MHKEDVLGFYWAMSGICSSHLGGQTVSTLHFDAFWSCVGDALKRMGLIWGYVGGHVGPHVGYVRLMLGHLGLY